MANGIINVGVNLICGMKKPPWPGGGLAMAAIFRTKAGEGDGAFVLLSDEAGDEPLSGIGVIKRR